MNLTKTDTIENAIGKGYPVYVTFKSDTKEIVAWYPFGKKLAESEAAGRCAKNGPDTYDSAPWEKYVFIRDAHEKHLLQLEEIERRL